MQALAAKNAQAAAGPPRQCAVPARTGSRCSRRPAQPARKAQPIFASADKVSPLKAQAVDDIAVYTEVSTQSVADAQVKLDKPRVVVLGSGWASACFFKALPKDIKEKYEVVMVSPRNYFLYTPLLPAVAVGTMEERSIVEPVRNLVLGKGDYYEAVCKAIDPVRKELVACFPKDAGLDEACFKIAYDILIIGVGSVNNTFGVKGVAEYCQFFKSIEDANTLRKRISECFERAALPYTPEEERKKLLSFVICGGGPTGVEVAAEIHDFVFNDLKAHYPELLKDVRIRVIELMDYVLSTYDRKIGEFTHKQFERAGIELVLNTRVASVRDGYVSVVPKSGEEFEIPFGSCVWATGIAMNPLIKELQQQFPEQTHFRSALTDEFLRVKGSDGSIWAFGDASTIEQPRALQRADELFEQADTNKDGLVGLKELQALLTEASKEFSHLEEHARFLEAKNKRASHLEEHARFLEAKNKRFGGLLQRALAGNSNGAESPMQTVEETDELTKEQFKALLEKIDSGLRALPATAQVAKQQGEYLAEVLKRGSFDQQAKVLQPNEKQAPFKYNHKGSLAYVGGDQAVMDIPKVGPIFGTGAGIMWKGYETFAQISLRNQLLVISDWVRTKLFGRDISRV
uniref:NADH:ubiquinone reductase (non-electrogenic) n=1 Tax=Tetradesmus obliquus TaxID=3088 RepID=A0A383VLR6_TETOB